MDVTWSSVPGPSNPWGQLTSALLLSTPFGLDVCFSLSCSPLISWAYWVMIAHQHPVTEDVSRLSGIQEAPAESTVCAQKAARSGRRTCTASQSLLFIYIEEESCKKNMAMKNRQGDIYYLIWTSRRHNLRQTVCSEWHQKLMKDPGWGYSFWLPSSPADGPIHLCDALLELNSISSFSCSLFSPHSIPFHSLPFHSLQFMTLEASQAKCWPWFPGVSREAGSAGPRLWP